MSAANPSRDDFSALLEESFSDGHSGEGQVVKGLITAIEKDMAIIDVGLKVEGRGGQADHAAILADIVKRDERDMGRADSPLRPAPDAHLLDTSNMSIEAAFQAARTIVDDVLAKRNEA